MKIPSFTLATMLVAYISLNAQTKAGLMRDNVVLQAHDTIAVAYPSGEAIIIAVLLDANNTIIGTTPVQWSMTGTLTIIDTPYVSNKILIDASLAMNDQKGFIVAQAASPGVTWVSNKLFLNIKGKNSGILRERILTRKEDMKHPFNLFAVSGRQLTGEKTLSTGICILQNPHEKTVKRGNFVK